jgi:hypothetical protein
MYYKTQLLSFLQSFIIETKQICGIKGPLHYDRKISDTNKKDFLNSRMYWWTRLCRFPAFLL